MASKVAQLAHETAQLLGGEVRAEDIWIEDDHIGPGYAVRTEGGKRAIELFARKEGIFLDRFREVMPHKLFLSNEKRISTLS
jgi:1-aminocyclopropane-1-carboxylate deaminase/D-cysteine desulfhydrase-like pyridoxal-dependent ACC family enzyme